ncbi:Na(+)/citrate cotransporter-like isoform X2 [Clytia hemisphaerica]|uniref:Uncharacterized protein n=1 Tax=Clytia hemisphaerica TaxID=252671 RepID=A0A7M5X6E0_9CNID
MENLKRYKRLLILVLTPILLSPMVIAIDEPEMRCAYGIAIMAVFWVTEVTPLAVTSLLPLIIFPFLGLLPAKVVCMQYMKDTNILLLGGLLIALAIERWNVHKRVALLVLLMVGTQPRRLMLGFMVTTAFISMWITNTATTAMMTPIMEAVLKQLDKKFHKDGGEEKDEKEQLEADEEAAASNGNATQQLIPTYHTKPHQKKYVIDNGNSIQHEEETMRYNVKEGTVSNSDTMTKLVINSKDNEEYERHRQLCKAMLLCICYSANIGGTGTLTGTAPQLVLAGQVDDVFPKAPSVSFIFWFVYAFPQMLIFLLIAWIYLQAMFLGIGLRHFSFLKRMCGKGAPKSDKGKEMYDVMKKQYDDLGPVTYAEITVLINFLMLVLLWFFREPKFMPGWGELFKAKYISDGTAAIIIGFLLFQLPSQTPEIFAKGRPKKKLPSKTILEWKYVSEKFPWNVLFLLGAGFALATACKESGLSLYLSCQLSSLKSIPESALVFIICTMLTFLTEITSNTATATILLPILASLGQSIGVNPLYMMVPATVCASFAFMLPVATPPNAIVFGTGRLTVADMAKAGFGMNIIGILLVTLSINTWGYEYYDLGTFPEWARASESMKDACYPNATIAMGNSTLANSTFFY